MVDIDEGLLLPMTQEELLKAEDRLAHYLNDYQIEVEDGAVEKEIAYLRLLLQKTQQLNLTAIKDFDKGLILHLLDSLLYLKPLFMYGSTVYDEALEDEVVRMLDMGTGGGMPGIPLALAEPDITGVLNDSVKKKVVAVGEFVEALGLQDRISTSSERLEELALKEVQSFSVITARALSSLVANLEYASPLLAEDGILIVSKGKPDKEELRDARKVERVVGMELITQESYELPDDFGHRELFVYGKVAEPQIELPRPVGFVKSHPLV